MSLTPAAVHVKRPGLTCGVQAGDAGIALEELRAQALAAAAEATSEAAADLTSQFNAKVCAHAWLAAVAA